MENFIYYTPTKVVFGKGSEKQVGELVKEQGQCEENRSFGPDLCISG